MGGCGKVGGGCWGLSEVEVGLLAVRTRIGVVVWVIRHVVCGSLDPLALRTDPLSVDAFAAPLFNAVLCLLGPCHHQSSSAVVVTQQRYCRARVTVDVIRRTCILQLPAYHVTTGWLSRIMHHGSQDGESLCSRATEARLCVCSKRPTNSYSYPLCHKG